MNIQAVVISSDGAACKTLGEWLHRNAIDWRYSAHSYDVNEVRNMAVKRFLDEDVPNRNKTHLMLIDNDMVPMIQSSEILHDNDKQCVYLGTIGPFGAKGHRGHGDLGENFCRLSADALKQCHYPYFKAGYDGDRRVHCEGNALLTQLQALAIPSHMVGIAGITQSCVLVPAANQLGWVMTWAHLANS